MLKSLESSAFATGCLTQVFTLAGWPIDAWAFPTSGAPAVFLDTAA
jgi:hypothetical protein